MQIMGIIPIIGGISLAVAAWIIWKAIKMEYYEEYGDKPPNPKSSSSIDQWDEVDDIIDDLY